MSSSNRLYRSNTDKIIGGVAGGLADYFNLDAVVIRILFVLLAIFGGGGVLIYIILWIAIPAQVASYPGLKTEEKVADDPAVPSRKTNTSLIAGILLIVFGALILVDRLMPFYSLTNLWPLLLVLAGLLLLVPEISKTSKNIKS
ncbi:MAG: PspC domain-containing protein [Chlorobi bacterium]|nr:PspC domain-containing protein [Chlorobiota bacterium]